MNRRQPLLVSPAPVSGDRRRVGEFAGGTAAECAAVCCCCPLMVMNLVVVAVYKVPTGLCRKAWKQKKKRENRRKKTIKKALLQPQESSKDGDRSSSDELDGFASDGGDTPQEGAAASDFETEMRGRFYGTGFWRSPSQREL